MEFDGLTRLEDIVGRLLSQYAELKEQNKMLAVEVEEKKQELDRLNEKIVEMSEDKEKVHVRVSSILTKLEEWESVKETSDVGTPEATPETQADPDAQKQLFNMGV